VTGALLFLLAASAASAPLTHVDVFRAGSEGYHSYRIPALVAAPDGSLLAFAEGRKQNAGDPGRGDIDLVCRRSTDGGATWSALQVLDDPGQNWSASNPVPVVDRDTKRVWLVYNRWEPGHGTQSSRPGTTNNQTWARWSGDNGVTWSAAIDLTRAARDFERWGAMFTGPGGGIQTRSGRLVIPAAAKIADGPGLAMRAYVVYSDDHGKTWQRGALVESHTDENQIVQLPGGDLLMDARQGSGGRRWVMRSRDGGAAWSAPQPGETVTPVCTSLTVVSGRTLWVGPAGPGRRRLVARLDGGADRVIYDSHAAYSSTIPESDGGAAVLWERGDSAGYQFISFTRLPPDFLR
jgi:sialidase-1